MLDLACGTGHMMERFAGRFAEVVALDHSQAMLAAARHKAAGRGWSHVDFVCSDVYAYMEQVPPGHFDFITCVGFLHHVLPQDVAATLTRLARLLAPQGVLLLSEPIKISATDVPPSLNDWNRRSLAARTGYSVQVEEPEEEPLDGAMVLHALASCGLQVRRMQRSFEVFPHNDPPSLRDRFSIGYLNWRHGRSGNVMTVAAHRA